MTTSLRFAAMHAWFSAFSTLRYASCSLQYLPTMAMVSGGNGASAASARAVHASRRGDGCSGVRSSRANNSSGRRWDCSSSGTRYVLVTSLTEMTWLGSTWQNSDSFFLVPRRA